MLDRRFARVGLLALLLGGGSGIAQAGDYEEGGYVAPDGLSCVWNFVRNFSHNQYYYTYDYLFTSSNNSYTDNMDFSYYCGHGSPYWISQYDYSTDLSKAGRYSHKGYGNADLEFIAFHSCKVVPGPWERSDWWTPWVNYRGIFDGLHQALGFRTDAYIASAPDISYDFGRAMRYNGTVWQNWFDSIDDEGYSSEHGCAVMHPTCVYDSYYSWAADPPSGHTNLTVWWQY